MTITLFAAPGACSRVPLISLEEAGAEFDVHLVRLWQQEHKTPEYRAMNPASKVPVLRTDDGVLTQNVAIARYLGAKFPGLLPQAKTPIDDARITADLAFCADTLHPLVTRIRMPMFMVDGAEAQASVREKAIAGMEQMAQVVEDKLAQGPWWYGDDWSIVDAYLFWVWFRIGGTGFPQEKFPNWGKHAEAMNARPAVQRALARDNALQAQLDAEAAVKA